MFGCTSRESGKQCLTSSKNAQNKNVPKRESPRRVPRSRRIFSDSSLNRIHGTAIFIYEIYHTTSSICRSHRSYIISHLLQECLEVSMLYISRSYIQIYWILFSLSHFGPCNKSSNSIFSTKYVNVLPKRLKLRIGRVSFLVGGLFTTPSKNLCSKQIGSSPAIVNQVQIKIH